MVKYTAVFSHNEIPCSKQNEQSNCAQKYRYSQTVNVKETIQERVCLTICMCVYVYIFPTRVKSYILLQDRKMGFIFAIVMGSRQSGILECWQCYFLKQILFCLMFMIVQLIYNAVLVSAVQQSDSVIYIHIPTLFKIIFPYRPFQSIEQSFLCYTEGSFQLSISYVTIYGFSTGSLVKNSHAKQEKKHVQSLGLDDPLEQKQATYSKILAWKIPWTEEPGRLQPMGSQESQTQFSN